MSENGGRYLQFFCKMFGYYLQCLIDLSNPRVSVKLELKSITIEFRRNSKREDSASFSFLLSFYHRNVFTSKKATICKKKYEDLQNSGNWIVLVYIVFTIMSSFIWILNGIVSWNVLWFVLPVVNSFC